MAPRDGVLAEIQDAPSQVPSPVSGYTEQTKHAPLPSAVLPTLMALVSDLIQGVRNVPWYN